MKVIKWVKSVTSNKNKVYTKDVAALDIKSTMVCRSAKGGKPIEYKGRAVGNTTRLVDYYIQELFNQPNIYIKIEDHFRTRTSHKKTLQIVLKRLNSEHPATSYHVDFDKLSVAIIK